MAKTRARGSAQRNPNFNRVPAARPQRSTFDRSQTHSTTIESGILYPLWWDETLPGDAYSMRPSIFVRLSTPLRPYMDGLYFDWQLFWCPNRLLWENWVRMMGERTDPADHNDYTVPYAVGPATWGSLQESLPDYLGVPLGENNVEYGALPQRMYGLVWQEWYRDANLQDALDVPVDDGPDAWDDIVLMRRGKRKDYFSGALPWTQRGDAVSLPLGVSAPVTLTDGALQSDGGPITVDRGGAIRTLTSKSADDAVYGDSNFPSAGSLAYDGGIELADLTGLADLSSATAATINDIRVALATQHLLERDARGGGRYREIVLAHFGVQTDDVRLMRPELLGTGSIPFQVAPVAATNEATTVDLGELGAVVTAGSVGGRINRSFSEHGHLMLIGSVRAELTYQQGLERAFNRRTRLDYFWPDLQQLGEQAITMRELYIRAADLDAVWGYTPRYEEYRHRQNRISGQFRSDHSASLDVWHLALDFASEPVLNDAFVQEQPHVDRIVKVTTVPEFLVNFHMEAIATRPMGRIGIPGLTRF